MKIKQSDKNIKDDMMNSFYDILNMKINKNKTQIILSLKLLTYNYLYNCPEMISVRSGSLKYDFGLDSDPTAVICNSISSSINIEYSRFSTNGGKFEVQIQPGQYRNLISLKEAEVRTEKGVNLPWLDWLLNAGDTIIVADFGVKYTDGGRSGGAIMDVDFRPFRVNPEFSGTPNDNFITRTLNEHYSQIQSIIWQNMLA